MKLYTKFIIIILIILTGILSFTVFYPSVDFSTFNFDSNLPIDLNFPEKQSSLIKEGSEKSIRWKDSITKKKQDFSFVFLHGFTGYKGELSPLIESVQDDLPANLFYQRISGHGYKNNEIANTTIDDWAHDINESHSYAKALGKRKVFFANSTGAGMSLLLTRQFEDESSCLIFFSPNFGLKNKISLLGTGPLGNLFIKMIIGNSFKMPSDNNPLKSPIINFTTIKPFLELTKIFRKLDLKNLKNPLLIFYSKSDNVVDTEAIESKFNSILNNSKIQLLDIGNGHLLADWNNEAKRNEVKKIITTFINTNCTE